MKAIVRPDGAEHVVLAIRMTAREWQLVHRAIGNQNIREFAKNMMDNTKDEPNSECSNTSDRFLGTVFNVKPY